MTIREVGSMWDKVIEEIVESGQYSEVMLAGKVGVSKEAIRKLRKRLTKEPRFSTGSRLLGLHRALRPEEHKDIFNVSEYGAKQDRSQRKIDHLRLFRIEKKSRQ